MGASSQTLHAVVRAGAVGSLRVFNCALALLILLLTLPLFAAIALGIWLTSGRPILHRGWRLGQHKKPFLMYKFRTLVPGAHRVLNGNLFSDHFGLTTPIGKFLRDTRLDELPQLLNIVTGDMAFVGPRPERPEVYEKHCREIMQYDRRFAVKPGLIGVSQLYTPHGTPKRLRTLLDNWFVKRNGRGPRDLALVTYTGTLVLAHALRRVGKKALKALLRIPERRRYRRADPRNAEVLTDAVAAAGNGAAGSPIVDINDEALCIVSNQRLENGAFESFRIRIPVRRNGRLRVRAAACTGELLQVRPLGNGEGWAHVVRYEPRTPLGGYVVQQYFLGKSLARPFRAASRRQTRAGGASRL